MSCGLIINRHIWQPKHSTACLWFHYSMWNLKWTQLLLHYSLDAVYLFSVASFTHMHSVMVFCYDQTRPSCGKLKCDEGRISVNHAAITGGSSSSSWNSCKYKLLSYKSKSLIFLPKTRGKMGFAGFTNFHTKISAPLGDLPKINDPLKISAPPLPVNNERSLKCRHSNVRYIGGMRY